MIRHLLLGLGVILILSLHGHGLPLDESLVVRQDILGDMRKYMNESIDPCEDFNAFACGNWPKFYPASEKLKRRNIFEIMSTDYDKKLQELLATDDEVDTELDRKLKNLYRSCVALSDHWDEYLRKLKETIAEFGEMPLLSNGSWDESKFDWQDVAGRMQYKYNVANILNVGALPNFFNTSVQSLYVMGAGFGMDSKKIYNEEEHKAARDAYKAKISKNLQTYLGVEETLANRTAAEFLDIEKAIIQGVDEDGENVPEPEATIEEMQLAYGPVLDIRRFINTTWGYVPPVSYFPSRSYLENLVKVLPGIPKKSLANYIYYTFLTNFLHPKTKTTEEQQKECLTDVKKFFTQGLENVFYHKYGTAKSHEVLQVIWTSLQQAFLEMLQDSQLDWLDASTRAFAIEKLKAMRIEIPASEVDESYGRVINQITMDSKDYLKNVKRTLQVSGEDERNNLMHPPGMIYIGAMMSFTPMNYILQNKVLMPVAMFQPKFLFSSAMPQAYNFGRLATALGHELIHGFDDNGRMYDKFGNRRNWWDEKTSAKFNDRVKCFVDQYQKYSFGGSQLPMRKNQGENIADNSGTRLAYLAYLKWYESKERQQRERDLERLDGFAYNHKQLFFISYAQLWCADTDAKVKKLQVAIDEHTPAELRAAAALSNMKEFAEEFKCPAGSAMNPSERCRLY